MLQRKWKPIMYTEESSRAHTPRTYKKSNDNNDGEIYFIVEDPVLRDRMVRGPAG